MTHWTARQREYFVAAAEMKEISKITEFLEVTRQAVGQALTAMSKSEECQDVPLWVGSPGGQPTFPFVLTPAGEQMVPHIRELVAKNQSATRNLASFRGGQQGRVRVGCLEVHLEGPLGLIAPRFRSRERLITVDMGHGSKDPTPSESSPDLELLLWKPLQAGRLDMVFGGEARREFDSKIVYTTWIVAGVRADHAWRKRGWVEIGELLEHPLGMLPSGYFSRDSIAHILASYGLTEPAYTRPTVRSLELLRDGAGVIPVVADEGIGGMDESPFPRVLIDGSSISGNMCVHWRKTGAPTSEVAKRFLEFVRNETPGEGRPWNANMPQEREH